MRAFITGMGTLSSIGENLEASWQNLLQGNHGIGPIEAFDATKFRTRVGAEMRFNPVELGQALLPGVAIKNLTPPAQIGLLAAQMAITHAALDTDVMSGARAGVVLGSGLGGIVMAEAGMRQVMSTEPYCTSKGIHPLTVPFVDPNFCSALIARTWGFLGPQFTVCTACSSSTHALGQALMMIQSGRVDIVMAGGMEVSVQPLTFACFDQMRAMSNENEHPDQACKPFSSGRSGFVMGDAAGMLVIESERSMEARGATPLAELVSYGASGGGFHMVKPRPDASDVKASMMAAIDDAGIPIHDIDCVNTHGTGTQLNDESELDAINSLFAEKPEKVLLMANKANVGHTLGAAGAIEAIFSIQAICDSMLPPFINFEADDGLDYSRVHIPAAGAEKHKIRTVMSNSFGFGNNNATIILRGVE